jgi:hypothetical protein
MEASATAMMPFRTLTIFPHRLLFGVLPTLKASWKSELNKQRDSYYVGSRFQLSFLC